MPAHENLHAIHEALKTMLGTGGEFVQVEIPGTDHFVQFANTDGRILLDLPLAALDGGELDRAEAYFARMSGVKRPWFDEIEGGETSYRKDFGEDSLEAARCACEIFDEVYRSGPTAQVVVRSQ
ncbi:MAG TPA: hypothetical protein VFG50_15705 [Rhodothermales bacterium]|nr:hypothetical protein [Rhodothermales bacterium]